MAMIDPEQERERLLDYYSRQMDGRLEHIAAQAAGLNDLAREVLKEELIRRGLGVELLQLPHSKQILPEEPGAPSPEEAPVQEQPSSGEFEKRDLVTIRKFRDLPEALLAKGSLDSSGIESVLADDNVVRVDWLWSNLLGGVKLLVDAENVPAANEILNQPIPENFDAGGFEDYQQPRCPRCDSLDVSFEELYKPLAYGSLFVGLPLPVHRKGWICQSCRHTWQEDDAENSAAAS